MKKKIKYGYKLSQIKTRAFSVAGASTCYVGYVLFANIYMYSGSRLIGALAAGMAGSSVCMGARAVVPHSIPQEDDNGDT